MGIAPSTNLKTRLMQRLWDKAHPEVMRASAKRYCQNHPDRIKAKNKREKALRNKLKLEAIKTQLCICPGCGINFSCCNDEGLLIIFDKSHVHSTKCSLRDNKQFFWSCGHCNTAIQRSKCGTWDSPGNFKEICKER
jgi:hypothetical protein